MRPAVSAFFAASASWIAAALAGCCSVDPELKALVDARARSRPLGAAIYPAGGAFEPMQLAPGQWTEHIARGHAEDPTLLRQEVVSAEDEGFWIRQTLTTYYKASTLRFLIVPKEVEGQRLWEVRRVQHVDREGRVREVKDRLEAPEFLFPQRPSESQAPGTAARPLETVTVPAGRFEGCSLVNAEGARQWFHPAVPITGLVLAVEAETAARWELVGFGIPK